MLLVALIWGVNFSVTKGAFDTFPPFAFTGVRFALASLLLVPLVHRLEGAEPLPRGALVRLIGLGVVGNTLYQLAWISGLERTTASNSALILASVLALVGAAFTTVFSIMLARIYLQLAGPDHAGVSVPSSGT